MYVQRDSTFSGDLLDLCQLDTLTLTHITKMTLLNKNTVPNLAALALIVASTAFDGTVRLVMFNVGLFALSGALTNWLAIYMLFDRVPGLYGSGVVPLHFEEFKRGIMGMVTKHLFKKDRVDSNLETRKTELSIDLTQVIEGMDLDIAYDQLVDVIMESSFGAMLGMVGGAQALEPMRSPFKKRMHKFMIDTTNTERFKNAVSDQLGSITSSEQFLSTVTDIVQSRLDELTPAMVKDIVKEMIHKHLGWLVVWGAVFGGLIGLISTLILN